VFGLVDGRPVEPLYVRRTQGETPEYDLRDVDETVIVRVSESEFSGIGLSNSAFQRSRRRGLKRIRTKYVLWN